MVAHEELVGRVRKSLEGAPDVEEKRMFGGIAFMVRGRLCVSVGRNRLLCRIDPAIHDVVVKRNGCRTMVMKRREYRGYVHVDADALKSARDLNYWLRLALDYNTRTWSVRSRLRARTR